MRIDFVRAITLHGELRKDMRDKMQLKNLPKRIGMSFLAIMLLSTLFMSACSKNSNEPKGARENVYVTVFNGEHYKVKGENKRTVKRGESVAYEIELDEGYELISSFGVECAIPRFKGSYTFTPSVEFSSVNYYTAVTFETRKLDTTEFTTASNKEGCEVEMQTASGYGNGSELYVDDAITLYAIPSNGYRFHCWSVGNYLSAGGRYLSSEKILNEFDFNSTSKLYANFKSTADLARTIIYDMQDGNEIEQDCSAMLAHHYRANTLTEPDLLENGYELPKDKMLVGWETQDDEYVGLGSRTAVSDETYITLYSVWKEYSPASDFVLEDGKITAYNSDSKEVVVPKEIGGREVTAISSNAFEECAAETYYLPNTITSIEEDAFLNCTALKEIYMSDNIMNISDESFRGCKNFMTLHLNAYLKPRYISNWRAYKADYYDKLNLDKNSGKIKLIIFGGSSVRYGYNSEICSTMINDVDVYNLGNDWTACAFAQFELLKNNLNRNDIFLHAPEISDWAWYGFLSVSSLTAEEEIKLNNDYIYILAESNIGSISYLTVNKYSDMFNMLSNFNKSRIAMPELSYADYFVTVESEFGHYKRGQTVVAENGVENYCFNNPAYLNFNIAPKNIILTDSNIYRVLTEKEIKVFVTFSSINKSNLLLTYQTEEDLLKSANSYTQLAIDSIHHATVILNQNDTIYSGEHFADSDFHLGSPFSDVHTTKVMNALIQALGL